ncbi:MAG: matrixin family metalloprotease [Acidobacteriota bacterium]|nr:matrixin family metalloprotease [Acidobacteriota bacterium]
MMRRALMTACLVSLAVAPAAAYLRLGFRVTGGGIVSARWTQKPVQYFVTNRGDAGVTAPQFQAAMGRAFATWANEPTIDITFNFAGFTGAEPFDDDGMNVLGFQEEPGLERVLGATGFTIDTTTGRIVESDIFFNTIFDWSVAPAGEANRFDLESTAVHEIGHFIGLGHSAIGETELIAGGRRRVIAKQAVMFPIAFPVGNILDRQLKADDIAGASDIYPEGSFARDHGSIAGTVRLDGRGVFGAHVTAFSLRSGKIVGNFTLSATGEFVIAGLEPGLHVVRVEPIDDGDVGSFFDADDGVEVQFLAAIVPQLVSVPKGGSAGRITIDVRRR